MLNIGDILLLQGNYMGGLDALQKGLSIKQEIRDTLGEARALSSIGESFLLAGDVEHAEVLFNNAFKLYQQIGSRQGEASVYLKLGKTYQRQSNHEGSIDEKH